VIERGVRENAWAPDVDVAALAMDLAQRLGGETAEEATRLAGRAGVPESIRAVAERGERDASACRPR
jgi:hypothetical protein